MRTLNIDKLKNNIKSAAQYDLSENNIFGSGYVVSQNNEIVYKEYFGVTSPNGNTLVTDDTIFRLASMTKPITSIAMLILIQRGLISLSDQVKKYLPEFEDIHIISPSGEDLGKSNTPVTIMHLLTHTSGVGGSTPQTWTSKEKSTIQNTASYFAKRGLSYEPFTKQAYSATAAFDVLAAIAEKVTDEDYEEFLKREIFVPCNMKNTTFMPSEDQWKRVITMHNKIDGKSTVGNTTPGCVFEDFPASHKLAGAGLISTIPDYLNFTLMLLNKGKIKDTQIVSEEIFNMMSVPYVPKSIMPEHRSWGLGVRVIVDKEYELLPVGSFGWSGAYGGHFWIDPVNKITAVYLKNSRIDGGSGGKSAYRFEEAVHDALI